MLEHAQSFTTIKVAGVYTYVFFLVKDMVWLVVSEIQFEQNYIADTSLISINFQFLAQFAYLMAAAVSPFGP